MVKKLKSKRFLDKKWKQGQLLISSCPFLFTSAIIQINTLRARQMNSEDAVSLLTKHKETTAMSNKKGLSFYKRRKKISQSIIKEIFSWIFGIVVAIFIAAVLNYFFGITTNVVGVSMEPTLYNEQKIYINRFIYTISAPKVGDVVVFMPNGNKNTHYYVKRVIAVPGDTIVIINGICYVNGEESEYASYKILDSGIAENEITLGAGEFFCMGDNLNNSEDSRSANIGTVNKTDIIGQAWLHASSIEEGWGVIE